MKKNSIFYNNYAFNAFNANYAFNYNLFNYNHLIIFN